MRLEGSNRTPGAFLIEPNQSSTLSGAQIPDGVLPVAPCAIRPQATSYTAGGFTPCVTPRALATAEISEIIEQYQRAAKNALAAGFDGVEIHAANGYLIEQFLRDSTNKRTDAYGGSRKNRARFLLEVAEAVAGICGGERVGIRLSPLSPVNGADLDSDPAGTYAYVVKKLNAFGVAYIHVIEGVTQGAREVPGGFDLQILRRAFDGRYIANNSYDLALALEARRRNSADFIAFGRLYIANPDLVERLRIGAPLNVPIRATFFGGGAAGYTDYPALTTVEKQRAACFWQADAGFFCMRYKPCPRARVLPADRQLVARISPRLYRLPSAMELNAPIMIISA